MSVIENTNTKAIPRARVVSRREFVKTGIGVATALALVELGGLTWLFLQPRAIEGELGGEVVAGVANGFPLGSVTAFPEGRFYLVRTHDGGFLAISRRCPHLGCTVTWQSEPHKFFCPCHASNFDILGNPETAPAPRALDTFAVRLKGSSVIVDTSHLQSRQTFDQSQLVFE